MNEAALSLVGQAVANHELTGLVVRNATAYALLNLTLLSAALPAPSRALSSVFTFELEDVGLGSLLGEVEKWKESAVQHIKDAARGIPGLSDIVKVIKTSVRLAQEGVEVLLKAARNVAKLAGQLLGIYTTFKPLVPVFEGANFLVDLLSDYGNIEALVSVVRQLFGTAATLHALSGVCAKVDEILEELSAVYDSAMGKVSEDDKRRLESSEGKSMSIFSYKNFLQGIDFTSIRANMTKFSASAADNAKTLQDVNATLSPVLHHFDADRALRGPTLDPQDFQKAIETIVPTWQAVEGLGLAICKGVMKADHEADALLCRVKEFVNKFGDLIGLKNLLGECSVNDEADDCPKKILSDGVADQIIHHSSTLGWLIYMLVFLASCGCCGGGAMAVKKLKAPAQTSVEERAPLAQPAAPSRT